MNPICIVDDESSICSTLAGIFKDEGYPSLSYPDAESFWQGLSTVEPSLVLLDVWLPGIDGMVAAIKAGAFDFLENPLPLEVLLDKVASALKHRPAASGADLPSDTR